MKRFKVNRSGLLEIQRVLVARTFDYISHIDQLQPWVDDLEDKKDSGSTVAVEMLARHTKSRQVEYLELEDKHFDQRESEGAASLGYTQEESEDMYNYLNEASES